MNSDIRGKSTTNPFKVWSGFILWLWMNRDVLVELSANNFFLSAVTNSMEMSHFIDFAPCHPSELTWDSIASSHTTLSPLPFWGQTIVQTLWNLYDENIWHVNASIWVNFYCFTRWFASDPRPNQRSQSRSPKIVTLVNGFYWPVILIGLCICNVNLNSLAQKN